MHTQDGTSTGARVRISLVTGALMVLTIAVPAGTALAAGTAPGVGTGPAQSQAWTIQKSPDLGVPNGQLLSLSCSGINACTAVGSYLDTSGLNAALAESFNGSSYSRQRLPSAGSPVPTTKSELSGVSCPASSFCEAVGSYHSGAKVISLAFGWNGTAWTRQAVSAPAGSTSADLLQVSCTAATFCEADGQYSTSTGDQLAFAVGWDGTAWHLQHIPNPPGSTDSSLGGVSCVSASFCEAVGSSQGIGGFAVQWNGTSWQREKVPGTGNAGPVSCLSTAFCEAVGSGGGDIWKGKTWTAQKIPIPGGAVSARLDSVSCVTTSFCDAAGYYTNSSGSQLSYGATWNGKTWGLLGLPTTVGVTMLTYFGISCPAISFCEAVEDFPASYGEPFTQALTWNGSSWLVSGAAPRGAAPNTLAGVSCVSADYCEAVGSDLNKYGQGPYGLAAVWNGTSWKNQYDINSMSPSAVSCVSTSFCMAVGGSGGGNATTEEWQGAAWLSEGISGAALTGVSCTSTDFCMAVGEDGNTDVRSGGGWVQQAASGFTSLSSVSCTSATSCEATGSGPAGDGATQWNGSTWTAQATPAPTGGSSPSLSGISCTSAQSCEAVGSYLTSTSQQLTLAEVWDGTSWAVQPTPNLASSVTPVLDSVSCTSASSCTAVGQDSSANETIAEVWDGTAWSLQSTPSVSYASQNTLASVSCGAPAVCEAVGVTTNRGQIEATLAESGD